MRSDYVMTTVGKGRQQINIFFFSGVIFLSYPELGICTSKINTYTQRTIWELPLLYEIYNSLSCTLHKFKVPFITCVANYNFLFMPFLELFKI